MENNNEDKKEVSFTARVLAALIVIGMFGAMFYCTVTIYKGIIRQAVVEAIEQTRVKL